MGHVLKLVGNPVNLGIGMSIYRKINILLGILRFFGGFCFWFYDEGMGLAETPSHAFV